MSANSKPSALGGHTPLRTAAGMSAVVAAVAGMLASVNWTTLPAWLIATILAVFGALTIVAAFLLGAWSAMRYLETARRMYSRPPEDSKDGDQT